MEIREVRREEIGQAAALTARGMRDNPTHIMAFGSDDAKREQKLGALFGSVLPIVSAKAVLIGAYRGGQLVGIAGIAGPGNCRPSAGESVRMLPRLLLITVAARYGVQIMSPHGVPDAIKHAALDIIERFNRTQIGDSERYYVARFNLLIRQQRRAETPPARL